MQLAVQAQPFFSQAFIYTNADRPRQGVCGRIDHSSIERDNLD